MRRAAGATLMALAVALALGPHAARAVTDDEVLGAINRGRDYLLGRQNPDGSWPETQHLGANEVGQTEIALFTLLSIGVHPNRENVAKGVDTVVVRNLDFNYAVCCRAMAYARLQKLWTDSKRDTVRQALKGDVLWLMRAQGSSGGWTYNSTGGAGGVYDLSNTQMSILALREAALAGIEIPPAVWKNAQDLYCKAQLPDGSWDYFEKRKVNSLYDPVTGKVTPLDREVELQGYGSMTAAGLASLFITSDNLEPGRGCPCKSGQSTNRSATDIDRRIDMALAWLEKNFSAEGNPKALHWQSKFCPYWLYAVERVGSAAGYKYFGAHNWYKEGAEFVLSCQRGDGSWDGGLGPIPDTCFAVLFLYKARAPVLFSKLQYKGDWNLHRRDIANLTAYCERVKEQPFHWQIVGLQAPVAELHDAPILYITAETPPAFTDEEVGKLRAFTDTGGTILFEASCGNPAVRRWFMQFAKTVWPEWPLKPVGPAHATYKDPHALRQRPEVMGIDDGLRTFLFFSMEDVSCQWNVKAYAAREYLFQWGVNLFTYATDHSPLRAKLAAGEPAKAERYAAAVKRGTKDTVQVARLKYDGAWNIGRHYKPFENLADHLWKTAGIAVKPAEDGLAAADLGDRDAAYLTGTGPVALSDADREALKQYLAKGGFLWAEAAAGSAAFDQAMRKLAADAGWELKLLAPDHPLMSGKFATAAGYNVAAGVQFHQALRTRRMGRPAADLFGIYQGGKLVGVYSPFDVLFSATGYEACGNLGYLRPDALAVATNVVIYLTDRAGGTP
jgi:hypothetical protein